MKCIAVPVNLEAMNRLDYDQCQEEDLVEVIFEEHDYNELWDSGIIEILNNQLGKNIDDYEDENITDLDELRQCRVIIGERINIVPSSIILEKLYSQVNLAIDYKIGVFFYF
ncbi:hypothetical protein N7922_00220 [Kosakonia sp. ML.JS2a]|uniref:hypothetical protein n=1 Tax=Kosakonia sp. ML.JS2a TaxID=2980557 RepID=UPI0021DA82E3|nr:hypothetical protein [Kosakonia sp. ML.JS2a]UXY10993.1 hypothetical protein N7922_00220 [Kosakonia sp. ML.JS2a]